MELKDLHLAERVGETHRLTAGVELLHAVHTTCVHLGHLLVVVP